MTPAEMARLHAASFTTPRPWTEAEFVALLDSPLCFLLADQSGFLVGRVVADEAELLTLAVDPEARRQGAGGRLVNCFLDESRRRGARSAFLEVAQTNAAARALYRKAGFTETGRRRGYYRNADSAPVDALVLVMALA